MGILGMGAALASALAVAPQQALSLTCDSFVQGQPAVFTTSGGTQGWLNLLLMDLQTGDHSAGGLWFGLAFSPSFGLIHAAPFSAAGEDRYTVQVPPGPGLAGVSFFLQAAARVPQGSLAATSNVLEVKAQAVPANALSPLGLNLGSVNYYMPDWVFANAFASSDTFHSDQGPLTLRSDGYPASLNSGQSAWTLMFRDIAGRYPAGTYTCQYDGTGTVVCDFDAVTVNKQAGYAQLDVSPTVAGIRLTIQSTDAADPVRNVRLWMPGTDATQTFHPTYLQGLAPFAVLRFGHWARAGSSSVKDWSDRTLPDAQTQGGAAGVAPEYMVDLANTLHADPWFTIPHLATDDFVRQFATLVRDRLDADRKVYVEYTNEAWNSGFAQAQYCEQQGLALGLDSDPYGARLKYYSQRSVEIFRIFESVFGGTQRLVRVLGSQSANPWVGETIMDWQNAYQEADALAVAPYFGGALGNERAAQAVAMTVDEILDECQADVRGAVAGQMTQNAANAGARGLELIAYEGGQHLVGVGTWMDNATLESLFVQANRHARMKDIYLEYLHQWKSAGGGMFVLYSHLSTYDRFGSWGLREWQDQAAVTPKALAAEEFIAQNPRWW